MTQGMLPEAPPTARERLLSLRAQGFTLTRIAAEVGRSPRALRFVLSGERDGEQLLDALTELDLDGAVTHQAPRPVTMTGERVKVRGPGGKTVTPPPPAGAGKKRRRARTATATQTMSPQQLITQLLADGHTYTSIGKQVGRSASTVRRVHHGQSSGGQLTRPLGELFRDGVVTHQALRPVTKSGHLAKVPGPDGTWIEPPTPKGSSLPRERELRPSKTPIAPRPGRVPSTGIDQPTFPEVDPTPRTIRRGKAKDQPLLKAHQWEGGRAFFQGTVSRTGKDRKIMSGEIIDAINGAQNAFRRCQLKVHTIEILEDGSHMDRSLKLGHKSGYDPAAIAAAIDAKGGDAWGWMRSQIEDRYPAKNHPNLVVVGVDLDVY